MGSGSSFINLHSRQSWTYGVGAVEMGPGHLTTGIREAGKADTLS